MLIMRFIKKYIIRRRKEMNNMSEKVTKSNDTIKADIMISKDSSKQKNNMSGMKRKPQIKSGKSPLSIAKDSWVKFLKNINYIV